MQPRRGYRDRVTTPGDESRTELAWREIVENYGERAVLPDDHPSHPVDQEGSEAAAPATSPTTSPTIPAPEEADETGSGSGSTQETADDLPEVDRFRPPVAPPFPRPRTWQRGLAWAGIFVAPVLALVVGLFSIYVAPLFGWILVIWFVGGFLYLVREMPRAPRDPWDDGSRI